MLVGAGTARHGPGGHHCAIEPSPTIPAGCTPPLGPPCPSPSPHAWGTHVARCGARAAATEPVHPRPHPISTGYAAFWGQSRFFGARQTIALCMSPPVPPNTLVSATALCCKFPWSNYVLIYDNPGRAVEGGKCQSSLEVVCWAQGPPWLLTTMNFSISVLKVVGECVPVEQGVRPCRSWVSGAEQECPGDAAHPSADPGGQDPVG